MSQHRKGFFGQVRSPHHAELSLLLLSIIVTIIIETLEKSQRNPREIVEEFQRNPRGILEESQRNLGSLCNVKIKMSLVPGGYLSVPGVYLQVPGGYLWFLVCMSWFMAVICRFLVVICGSWWLSCTGCPIELLWTAKNVQFATQVRKQYNYSVDQIQGYCELHSQGVRFFNKIFQSVGYFRFLYLK